MKNTKVLIVFVCMMAAVNFASADTIRGISMDFVTIGNYGNAADTGGTVGCGAVSYSYRIGKYEVTNAQWNTFTTAVGAPTGNAYWTGAQQPTNEVSWYEAAQFCNYLTSDNKYSGAYKFDISGNFLSIDRVSSISTYGTTYVIPTENEWYKAAYYKPNASGYSLYANGTNTAPIAGVQSNYGYALDAPWDITNGTQEQNGTFDMMGNVWEWDETLFGGSSRGFRGGSYSGRGIDVFGLSSSFRLIYDPNYEYYAVGFRVAEIPEPASAAIMTLAGLFLETQTAIS
jgi:formylglycine-generating enzyme required for sulfatase activity